MKPVAIPPSAGPALPNGRLTPGRPADDAAAADPRPRLKHLAHTLEGLFLNQLFQAMRETVPEDQGFAAAPGREIMEGLLDEKMADAAAQRMNRGIGEALYHQLARRIEGSAVSAAHGALHPPAASPLPLTAPAAPPLPLHRDRTP